MSITVDTSQLRALAADFGFAAVLLEHDVSDAFERGSYEILGRMQVGTPVDTGHLVNSEHAESHGLHLEVAADADYADYVERGTSRMAPQPYAGPSFDGALPSILDDIADQALAAIAGR